MEVVPASCSQKFVRVWTLKFTLPQILDADQIATQSGTFRLRQVPRELALDSQKTTLVVEYTTKVMYKHNFSYFTIKTLLFVTE